MRTLTIDNLLARAVYLGSLDGQVGPGLRHEEEEAFTEANACFRTMIEELEREGFDWYRDSTDPDSLPARSTDFDRRVIPWPVTYRRVIGVDVRQGSSDRQEWRALDWLSWPQRHTFAGLVHYDGIPTHYTVRDTGDDSESGEIHLLPGGTGAGQYVVHFAPEFSELTTGGVFTYPNAAAEDYHAASLAYRMCGCRDGDADGRASSLREMMANSLGTMKAAVPQVAEESRLVEMGANMVGSWFGTRRR